MAENFVLYGREGSGSAVCEAVLALTGLPHELVESVKNEDGTAPFELLALNPLGQVPTLVMPNQSIMTESAAICIYLADLGSTLAPKPGDALRAQYLRWMVYLSSNNYMTDLRFYYADRFSIDETHADGIRTAAAKRKEFEWDVIAAFIGEKPFMLGAEMSVVDIYAAMLICWIENREEFFARHPNVVVLYKNVMNNPKINEIWLRHGFEV